ncbi:MAG TPA: pilus assembly PilX N-terminal domain-containing protein [Gemmatimonadales bacterium]|nr:pilus assembly PilX N-terminal domain-containing protein [Gemmatimonadales bacterium]
MKRMLSDEQGMALGMAIVVLVIVGAMVSGALFVATQDQRSAENHRRVQQAFGVTEEGVAEQVRNFQSTSWKSLAMYPITNSTATISRTNIPGLGSYGGTVYRVTSSQWLLDVVGGDTLSRGGRGARQRVGLLVRSIPSAPPLDATFATSGGSGGFRGGYKVSGVDVIPPGWTGCTTGSAIPGFTTNDTSSFTGKSSKNILGTPSWSQDTTLHKASMDTAGNSGISYSQLAAMASITLPGGTYAPAPVISGGVCNTTISTNWGSPLAPTGACADYFPIVHITGDLHVNGSYQGQGVLLVDGDATLLDFTFAGLVMIQGALAPLPDSTHHFYLYGGMQVKNQNNAWQDVWDIIANYSSCAMSKAFAQVPSGVSALRSRSWTALY